MQNMWIKLNAYWIIERKKRKKKKQKQTAKHLEQKEENVFIRTLFLEEGSLKIFNFYFLNRKKKTIKWFL